MVSTMGIVVGSGMGGCLVGGGWLWALTWLEAAMIVMAGYCDGKPRLAILLL